MKCKYKFNCANCSSGYIGETCCLFKTRIEEDIKKDDESQIFKHLNSTATCSDSYNSLCFKIFDKVYSKFDLKIKETLHINWSKPNLKAQQNNLALNLSLYLLSPLSFISVVSLLSFLFHQLFSLSLTLSIGIFYCLNYTLLLLHLFITNLVIDLITTM